MPSHLHPPTPALLREGASSPWTLRPGERFPRTVRSSHNLREVAPGLYVGDLRAVEYPVRWGLVVDLYGSSATAGRRHLYPQHRTICRPMEDGDPVPQHVLEELLPAVRAAVTHGRPVLVHCFPPGTMIEGEDLTPIEQVQVGARVYGSDGRLHRVLSTMVRHYSGPMVELSTRGTVPVRCTPEHPLLVLRPFRFSSGRVVRPTSLSNKMNGKYAEKRAPKFIWVKASEVEVGDFLVRPRLEERSESGWPDLLCSSDQKAKIPTLPDVGDDVAWALGMYVADGSPCGDHVVQWTLSKDDDAGRLVRALRMFDVGEPWVDDYGEYVRVRLNSTTLSRSFRLWFGDTSQSKKIPSFLLGSNWPKDSLVDGILDGDGTFRKERGSSTLLSTSLALARQVWAMKADGPDYPYLRRYRRSSGYPNASPAWTVEWQPEAAFHYSMRWEGHYCLPVTKKREVRYDGTVYNFEVEDTNDYLADGVVAHNCAAGHSRSASVAYGLLRADWKLPHDEARRRVLTPAGVAGGWPLPETFDSVRRWADQHEATAARPSFPLDPRSAGRGRPRRR